jgi:hypothetical protein
MALTLQSTPERSPRPSSGVSSWWQRYLERVSTDTVAYPNGITANKATSWSHQAGGRNA